MKHISELLKVPEIMIPKPGKSPYKATTYRPISLIPNMAKLFEKLLLKLLKPLILIEGNELISNHQFGFRKKQTVLKER